MSTCLVPGSFDPVTRGHMDLFARACALFDRVYIGVMQNSGKTSCFPAEIRAELLRRACAEAKLPVTVVTHTGLLADLARELDVNVMVRGLRDETDYHYETQFALVHRCLLPTVETVCLMQSASVVNISSQLVREVGRLGGDIANWVPACILEDVLRHLAEN